MEFFEVLVFSIIFSTVGFTIYQFFSYLKFRRTNGAGSNEQYEQLEAAFREYAHRTNKRIEHLEQLIVEDEEPDLEGNQHQLNESQAMHRQMGKMKNHLETR